MELIDFLLDIGYFIIDGVISLSSRTRSQRSKIKDRGPQIRSY
jgi:hypothetical protein